MVPATTAGRCEAEKGGAFAEVFGVEGEEGCCGDEDLSELSFGDGLGNKQLVEQ